ncbi:peptidase S41 [Labrys miyagiensis]|uniref:Peptidase S41 n=1 Tax=Labrys miyagiensis TaxID=346912 RepID=A0ABQ6C9F0_9HYPH|nr:peptidase S41 [Labrys miyagiensis]GLS16998.1 peptidase S41 [Labrys miyagiensis]
MRLNRRDWMMGAAAVLAGSSFPAFAWQLPSPETDLPDLTPAQIREDLTFLEAQWAPGDKSFNHEQRTAFESAIAEAIARSGTSSAKDLVLDVMRAVAIPRNGHTAPVIGRFLDTMPIRAWWFPDGLYILSAAPGFAELLGACIEKFGDMTAAEALVRVAPYISGTDQRIRYLSAAYLMSPTILRRIGVASQENDIPLTLRLRNGTLKSGSLGPAIPDPSDPREPVLYGWYALVPDEKDKVDRWVHVLDGVEKHSPGYGRPAPVRTLWIGDEASKILYVRSNFLDSKGKDPLADDLLFGVLQDLVVSKRPRFVIVDLRLNNGGNFLETMLFAQALPRLVPRNGQVFVLVSRATFSAALVTAAMLKRSAPDRVTLIGEPMGDEARFWAEPDIKTLPNSKIPVFYSTKFEDWERGCSDNPDCYWPAAIFTQGAISIEPEVKIDESFAEYAAGRDPVLDAALARSK